MELKSIYDLIDSKYHNKELGLAFGKDVKKLDFREAYKYVIKNITTNVNDLEAIIIFKRGSYGDDMIILFNEKEDEYWEYEFSKDDERRLIEIVKDAVNKYESIPSQELKELYLWDGNMSLNRGVRI